MITLILRDLDEPDNDSVPRAQGAHYGMGSSASQLSLTWAFRNWKSLQNLKITLLEDRASMSEQWGGRRHPKAAAPPFGGQPKARHHAKTRLSQPQQDYLKCGIDPVRGWLLCQ